MNGLMPRMDPATAVANSQRKNSAPRSYGSSRRTRPCWRSAPPSGSSPGAGTRPLPCLPVDSASSCSAQRPKPPGVSSMQTLSRPSTQFSPSSSPNRKPGFSSPSRHQPAIASARSSSACASRLMSTAATEEIGELRARLERRSRLRGGDEESPAQVELLLETPNRSRVSRVEHVQPVRPERAADDLRRQARAAHPEQDDLVEVTWKSFQLVDPLEHARGLVEPAEPLGLVGAGPDGRIAGPDPV